MGRPERCQKPRDDWEPKKIQTIFSNLKKKGIPQDRLERVYAPIVLPIGAETPEEIAVSIVAEMIQGRRKG